MIKLKEINTNVTQEQAYNILKQLKIIFEDYIDHIRELNIKIKNGELIKS